jgi:hypothetical protein
MSSSVLLFRALIIASVLSGLMSGVLDQRFPELVPVTVLRAISELPKPQVEVAVSVQLLSFLAFGCTLAAIAGLYMFKPWARGFALAVTLLSLVFYPLQGAEVKSGWALLLLDVSSALWGAVLAISYVSSLSHRFAFDYVERPDDLG